MKIKRKAMPRVLRSSVLIGWWALIGLFSACAGTKPGTHVELVDKGGQKVYVSGAAAPGLSQTESCRGAVQRAVGAIALKFAQKNDGVADDVAKAVGAGDGEVFLQGYAKRDALRAAVQDVRFDPGRHLCMATVRWTPPVFVRDAVLKYAEELKAEELRGDEAPVPYAVEPVIPKENQDMRTAAQAVNPPPSAPPKAPDPCESERKNDDRLQGELHVHRGRFDECMRRSQDEVICHRYKLYWEEAQGKAERARARLDACTSSN